VLSPPATKLHTIPTRHGIFARVSDPTHLFIRVSLSQTVPAVPLLRRLRVSPHQPDKKGDDYAPYLADMAQQAAVGVLGSTGTR